MSIMSQEAVEVHIFVCDTAKAKDVKACGQDIATRTWGIHNTHDPVS